MRLTPHRIKSLLAAEALAQHLRDTIARNGGITKQTLAYLDQWMRRTGANKYDIPQPTRSVFCIQCRKRHVYAQPCPTQTPSLTKHDP